MSLKKYFSKFTKDVSFIQLKPGTSIDVHGFKVDHVIPLPIMIEDLVDEVKGETEELKFTNMINGMIYTIGIDSEFPHTEEYMRILYAFSNDIENYIINSSMQKIKDGKVDESMIYLRAAYAMNQNNLTTIYNYAIALEEKAQNAYKLEDNKLGTEFLKEAMLKMEELKEKDIEDKYPMSNYKLGFYYRAFRKFIKAKEVWIEFMGKAIDEEAKEDVREALESIENDVVYEEGYSLILDGNPKEGLEKLLPLTEKYEKWWNLDFLVGVGLRQLGMFDSAIDYFKKVLEVNPAQIDTLNEMGLCKANTGDMIGAIEFFDKAVNMDPKNHELICNRGMAKLKTGDTEGAIIDIDKAAEINPDDEIVKACLEAVESLR